ncbi:MAG: di-trans,poly-cis-decaprenylcistransferase [Clostridia bacterium]|nr:di-trans,poly-cis-decaprenylcistransferase [Clostridia bacterium]
MKKRENKVECSIKHIAFIMDGNGRWAKKRGMPREFGHRQGAEVFRKIMRRCCELGIKSSTFYVFSTENWKRPKSEVNAILELLDNYLDQCEKEVMQNDVRFIFIGDMSVFSNSIRSKIEYIEKVSENNTYIANLALNYGGRGEIVYAVNSLLNSGVEKISEDDITNSLYTKESPPLDLIVRSGGDIRISNFLLWQSAYAELYFTEKLWPDLTAKDVDKIVENFQGRSRRFGGV